MLPQWIISLNGGPKRVNHSAVIVGHKIFMFGGYCMDDDYMTSRPIDVHVFNTYTNRWTKILLDCNSDEELAQVPCMRYGHASVAIEEMAYLWGGRNDVDGACHHLFSFDTCKLKWQKHPHKGDYPSGRDGHAMCVMNGNIYVFGGFEEIANCFSNDMFVLQMPSHVWCRIHYENNLVPTWRDFHTISALGKYIYVFGGRSDEMGPYHSDSEIYDPVLNVFDTDKKIWFQPVSSTSLNPDGRRSHSAFVFQGCLYIFGGYNSVIEQHFNDLWKYNPENNKWSMVKTGGTPPVPRRRQCCCMYSNKLYVFGGTSPFSSSSSTSSPSQGFGGIDDDNLHDHDDIHVLDFCPSLKTLCLIFAIRNKMDMSCFPADVQSEALMMTMPNNISKSCSHHG